MANQIRITPEIMRTRAGEYDRQGEVVEGVIREMDRLLNRLQEEWEGEASRSYAEKYQELRPGFVKAQELIGEIAKALRSTAKAVEDTDAAIAAQFRA